MVKIRSFSVGNGDMFYIRHLTDNFSIIDCCLPKEDDQRKKAIIADIKKSHSLKGITRFISTHPDQDHIGGLKELDDNIDILNFYCVKNEATKEEESEDFKHYCSLKNNSKKVFHLYKGCSRKWMNKECEERSSAGISILWPVLENENFKNALISAKEGNSPNNISPIIKYHLNDGPSFLWLGDLKTEFMESITNEINFEKINIIFAPHHGRKSGRIPTEWLEKMDPDIIIVGEAPSEDLEYYSGYNTVTQNSAGDITFYLGVGVVNIYVENKNYSVNWLTDNQLEGSGEDDENYIGTLEIKN